MIKLLIFENDRRFVRTLKSVFEVAKDIDIVATYPEANEVLEKVQEYKPDVILMDIQMVGLDGIQATSQIKKILPDIKVVMMTILKEKEQIVAASHAGADGYLVKNSTIDQYIQKVRDVFKGIGPVMTDEIGPILFSLKPESDKKFPPKHFNLTKRQKEVLCELVKGSTSMVISDTLKIEVNTVNTHLKNIYKKMEVHSQLEAVRIANQYHLCAAVQST